MMSKPTALDVATAYASAIIAKDTESMHTLRAKDCITDWVHEDAFMNRPDTAEEATDRYRALFIAMPDLDLEVKRTIVAEEVVVQEWTITGTNTGPLKPPLLGSASAEATGNSLRLRGVSILDIKDGFITRETIYLDNATWTVELGIDA